ncbi:MAG: hypothetical protein ABH851_09845 [Methanobacteriota archaeon]
MEEKQDEKTCKCGITTCGCRSIAFAILAGLILYFAAKYLLGL